MVYFLCHNWVAFFVVDIIVLALEVVREIVLLLDFVVNATFNFVIVVLFNFIVVVRFLIAAFEIVVVFMVVVVIVFLVVVDGNIISLLSKLVATIDTPLCLWTLRSPKAGMFLNLILYYI